MRNVGQTEDVPSDLPATSGPSRSQSGATLQNDKVRLMVQWPNGLQSTPDGSNVEDAFEHLVNPPAPIKLSEPPKNNTFNPSTKARLGQEGVNGKDTDKSDDQTNALSDSMKILMNNASSPPDLETQLNSTQPHTNTSNTNTTTKTTNTRTPVPILNSLLGTVDGMINEPVLPMVDDPKSDNLPEDSASLWENVKPGSMGNLSSPTNVFAQSGITTSSTSNGSESSFQGVSYTVIAISGVGELKH